MPTRHWLSSRRAPLGAAVHGKLRQGGRIHPCTEWSSSVHPTSTSQFETKQTSIHQGWKFCMITHQWALHRDIWSLGKVQKDGEIPCDDQPLTKPHGSHIYHCDQSQEWRRRQGWQVFPCENTDRQFWDVVSFCILTYLDHSSYGSWVMTHNNIIFFLSLSRLLKGQVAACRAVTKGRPQVQQCNKIAEGNGYQILEAANWHTRKCNSI